MKNSFLTVTGQFCGASELSEAMAIVRGHGRHALVVPPYADLCADCGAESIDVCQCCGEGLCPMCHECNAGFCSNCLKSPDFVDRMIEIYEAGE